MATAVNGVIDITDEQDSMIIDLAVQVAIMQMCLMQGVSIMLYKTLKRAIERGNYTSREDMGEKVSIIYANGQLTEEQYIELMTLLNEKQYQKGRFTSPFV